MKLTFVVQGDKVTETGISKHVTAKLQQRQLQRPWKTQFVFSTAPSDQLPSSVARESVQNLFTVEVSLENVSRTLHNQHWWDRGRLYESAAFDVKLIPGSADLNFNGCTTTELSITKTTASKLLRKRPPNTPPLTSTTSNSYITERITSN